MDWQRLFHRKYYHLYRWISRLFLNRRVGWLRRWRVRWHWSNRGVRQHQFPLERLLSFCKLHYKYKYFFLQPICSSSTLPTLGCYWTFAVGLLSIPLRQFPRLDLPVHAFSQTLNCKQLQLQLRRLSDNIAASLKLHESSGFSKHPQDCTLSGTESKDCSNCAYGF